MYEIAGKGSTLAVPRDSVDMVCRQSKPKSTWHLMVPESQHSIFYLQCYGVTAFKKLLFFTGLRFLGN